MSTQSKVLRAAGSQKMMGRRGQGQGSDSSQSPGLCRGSPDPAHSPFGLDVLKARAGVKGRSLGDGQSCSQILALPCT